jgi:hypothetical protein
MAVWKWQMTNFKEKFKLPPKMKPNARPKSPASARRWARQLCARVEKVLAAHPTADRDNVRHTLILLELPPLERLQRSLIRGRATAIFRK